MVIPACGPKSRTMTSSKETMLMPQEDDQFSDEVIASFTSDLTLFFLAAGTSSWNAPQHIAILLHPVGNQNAHKGSSLIEKQMIE